MRGATDATRKLGQAVYINVSQDAASGGYSSLMPTYDSAKGLLPHSQLPLKLYLFGSTAVFGCYEKGSDLDFVVLTDEDLQKTSQLDEYSPEEHTKEVDFLNAVEKKGRASLKGYDAFLIKRARVPVLRVKGGVPMPFDITFSRLNGVRNSALLRAYMKQCPLARCMCMFIRKWSKQVGVNSSNPGGFLTSYALNIMVLHYLLRKGILKYIPPESINILTLPPLPPEIPFAPLVSNDLHKLGELFKAFPCFYLREFYPEKDVITISRGTGRTDRSIVTFNTTVPELTKPQNLLWCIEDPYEEGLNVGRNITQPLLNVFLEKLTEADQTTFGFK